MRVCVKDRLVPGLLSVGGDSRSLIWASFSPSTHWTSKVRRRGQLEVQRAETATQEHPDSSSTRRPAGDGGDTKNLVFLMKLQRQRFSVNLFFSTRPQAATLQAKYAADSHSVCWGNVPHFSPLRGHKINQHRSNEYSYLISWMIQQRHV